MSSKQKQMACCPYLHFVQMVSRDASKLRYKTTKPKRITKTTTKTNGKTKTITATKSIKTKSVDVAKTVEATQRLWTGLTPEQREEVERDWLQGQARECVTTRQVIRWALLFRRCGSMMPIEEKSQLAEGVLTKTIAKLKVKKNKGRINNQSDMNSVDIAHLTNELRMLKYLLANPQGLFILVQDYKAEEIDRRQCVDLCVVRLQKQMLKL